MKNKDRKKKVIIVTKNMFAGGAERVIAQLANYFVSVNIECTLITVDKARVSYELSEDIQLFEIGKKSSNKFIDRIKRYTKIRKIIKNVAPTIVLSLPEDTGIYVILSLLGTKIPVYVSERNNPWVMPDVKITRLLRKFMYPFAKGIIFQTEMAKSFFPKYIQNKGIILPNPVDSSRVPVPFEGKREKHIVAAGRLCPQKNFPLLIRAFQEFNRKNPGYKLIIYGEGAEREGLEKLISQLNLTEEIELPGRKDNLLSLMNNAAMFVLSSDYEGLPNVLIEAMCMGMPVISTDCPSGGPRELIKNNINGILVSVNDKDALACAMKKMTDEKIAQEMGKNASCIRNKLTNKNVFEDWYNYLMK